jgi:hypothetical protein
VPEFLSSMWVRELDRAVRASAAVSALAPIVIDQVVTEVPGRGEVRYRLRVDADGAGVSELGAPGAPSDDDGFDVRLTTDYPTAVAISVGHENAQIALSRGRLRLGGNIDTLVRHAGVLAALDDAAVSLRGATTYPPPGAP